MLLSIPQVTLAAQLIYTVQTGSFDAIKKAQNQYEKIIDNLGEEALDYLRIEKIGNHHAVRLGKFESYSEAEILRQSILRHDIDAVIIKAYIKDKRIIQSYRNSFTGNKHEKRETTKAVPEKSYKTLSDPLSKDTIATISSLVKMKDYDAAFDLAMNGIAKKPDAPDLNAWLGTILLKMNKPSKALKYLEKAVELSPDKADYHNGLAYAFFFLNRIDRSIAEFKIATSLEPYHIDALAGLCMGYIKSGDKKRALEICYGLRGIDKVTSNRLINLIEKMDDERK